MNRTARRLSTYVLAALSIGSLAACAGPSATTATAPQSSAVQPASTPDASTTGPTSKTTTTSTTTSTASTSSTATKPSTTSAPSGSTGGSASVAGSKGTLSASVTLPHQGKAGWTKAVTWKPAGCVTAELKQALGSVVASRVIRAEEGESTHTEGVLQFASSSDATAFVRALAASYRPDCIVTAGDVTRTRFARASLDAGDLGRAVTEWTQVSDAGTWRDAPGGGLPLAAAKGRYVALAGEGGEFRGDLANGEAGATVRGDLRTSLDATLAQLGAVGAPGASGFAMPSYLVGDWVGHTRQYTLKGDGTGTVVVSSGCCEVAIEGSLKFTKATGTADSGTLTGTLTTVKAGPAWSGTTPKVGDSVRVTWSKRILTDSLTKAPYCGSGAPTPNECGA